MADNENTSTLQAAADYVKGAAQTVVGAVTGNPVDQQQAEDKKAEAHAKDDLSHSAAKVGPYTATPEGGLSKDNPNRSEGSWNQTIGSGKEMLGNLVGAEGLKNEGIEQNRQGKAQEAQGQLSDLGSGIADRAKGTIGGAVADVMGDEKVKQSYQEIHDDGKARQRGAEVDINKAAEAEHK